ncbi:MAG: SynChlorMet cassette protein ScmD [Dehalobacter sp.]|nr:SynChlorMet cassette protein ScmD [Dehalobacter sp.]
MNEKLFSNPSILLREEFDDWALLYDPGSGYAFGINPIGAFIWKRLDGQHTIDDLVAEVNASFTDVPSDVRDRVLKFVDTLITKGLAGTKAS